MANPDRIYFLHQLLGQRRPRSLRELAAELECSEPTVKRLLGYLRDHFNAPIQYDRERLGYHYSQTGQQFELPGLWFSESELYALLAAEHLLEQAEPGFLSERLRPLRERIRRLLGEGAPGADLTGRVRIKRQGRRACKAEIFRAASDAVLRQRDLSFAYQGRVRNDAGQRRVAAERLLHYRDNWYLVGWCLQRRAWRYFAVERIGAPIKVEQQRSRPNSAPPEEDGYGLLIGETQSEAVLRFSPTRARWIADELWHPRQQQSWLPDGRLELRFPIGDHRELLLDIMRYGDEVEVIAPPELRQAVIDKLTAALAGYR
jgi:predicted DNA-binding transcriptional regulator YafY